MDTLADWTTLARRWTLATVAAPEATFLEYVPSGGEVVAWTYREFDALIGQVQRAIATYGVRRGDRIQLILPNCPAFVAVLLAAARNGWIILPCDPRGTAGELARQAARVDPVLVVCGAAQAETYQASGAPAPAVVVDPEDHRLTALSMPGATEPEPVSVAPLDKLALMFTSGTTSEPKIVELTQANYAFAGDVMAAASGLRAGSRFLVVLPLFHANAQYYSVAAAISVGATVVLAGSFSASRFLRQAEQLRATHASLFAAPIRMILARAEPTPLSRPLENVWFSQNLTGDEYDRFAALVGCRPRQIYGMTETAPAVLMSRRLNLAKMTLGTPTLGCHVRLRDPDTGAPVEPGEIGEIQVGGFPGLSLFAGYRDNPAANAAAIVDRDGDGFAWLRTGDLGRLDVDGDVVFVGRGGDMLKVAGENVSVVELESTLVDHPEVLDAAVVGVPDAVRDEVPVAFVVPAAGASPTLADDLRQWCEERFSGPRRPREIHVVDELPRTAVGKIQRFRLAERGNAKS
ncbi:class I adenylate-forming enzyme family protein [Amycolatopsis pithecellobii]|uniref:class I adenylate-forming enzyme family protein n=1 Tax=Amycolatopsis pithecellobii TaxID=664692 RepID=UPI001407D718|nr:AMP-binding protein [Amycolatopsis pithecellobii]